MLIVRLHDFKALVTSDQRNLSFGFTFRYSIIAVNLHKSHGYISNTNKQQ